MRFLSVDLFTGPAKMTLDEYQLVKNLVDRSRIREVLISVCAFALVPVSIHLAKLWDWLSYWFKMVPEL